MALTNFVESWVDETAGLTKPRRVVWCDGSEAENDRLIDQMLADGTSAPLNSATLSELLPAPLQPAGRRAHRASHLHLLRHAKDDAGPTNNWMAPAEAPGAASAAVQRRDARPHDVRGPLLWARRARRYAKVGVEITDSPYVVANMRIMTRMGQVALDRTCARRRLRAGPALAGRSVPDRRFIVHFPEERTDLERRLRLRRQRAARQEVPRAAHRLDHGPRRGLARRAHADPRPRVPRGRHHLHRGAPSPAPAARPISPC